MRQISRQQLVNELLENRGCFPVTLATNTEPKMRKTANPYYGQVRKLSTVNGMFNWHYAKAVERQRQRENHPDTQGDNPLVFESHPRKWGERLTRADGTLTPFVTHNGNVYLELKVENVLSTAYQQNGLPLELAQIDQFLQGRTGSGRQEVENAIILRDYRLDHVTAINTANEQLILV